MSRTPADLPTGADGVTAFPAYAYDLHGAPTATPPPSPVQSECQTNIAVILTDDQKRELDNRLEAYHLNPNEGSPWQEVRQRIQKRA